MSFSDVAQDPLESELPELWQRFVDADNADEYCRQWLALQCRLIPRAAQAMLALSKGDGPYAPAAVWPGPEVDPGLFSDIVARVLDERSGLVLAAAGPEPRFLAAYPLLLDGRLPAIVALEATARNENDLRQVMAQLQWGVAWLEVLYRRQQNQEDAAVLIRLRAAVDLLAATLGEESFHAAAAAFVTEAASATQCDRVSLGFVRNHHVRIDAVSHSADIGDKMNLTQSIALAMDEAILQRRELVCPPPPDAEILILRDHEHLSRQQNGANVASFPLFQNNRFYGVLTCERPADHPFSLQDLEFFRAVAGLAAPALETMERNDRPLPIKIRDAATLQAERLFGPGHVGRKLVAALLLGLTLFFSLAQGEYRLAAETTLEGLVRRAVVAPFDGYIDQAPARAGDLVEQSALLCTLDARDLRLERLSRISQKSQLQRQHQTAVAKYDRAQAAVIEAQIDQAAAELELIETKLQRARLEAPFAGLLVSGDLSQRLGGSVEKGEVLFEVTPLDAYRVILEVDERWINDVRVGQQGSLALSAQPEKRYAFTISKITPIAVAENGRNFFRVEARLATIDNSLRPGMEGVGKISVDRRRLISIWTRELIEWLRLWLWRWLP
jgi:multidrug resistance efflux pump